MLMPPPMSEANKAHAPQLEDFHESEHLEVKPISSTFEDVTLFYPVEAITQNPLPTMLT